MNILPLLYWCARWAPGGVLVITLGGSVVMLLAQLIDVPRRSSDRRGSVAR